MTRLIVVAHALAPGPGGPESQVNLELVRALAAHWPEGVTVISGGEPPALRDGTPLASLPGWRVHALGESGDSALAQAAVRRLRSGGVKALPVRAAERVIHQRTGQGIKMAAWQAAATRVLARELEQSPGAVVWSRALPFASISAVDRLRRRPPSGQPFRWIVNVNDPMPASVWPGLYAIDPHADRRVRERFEASMPRIDALTFPSAALRDLELDAFPALGRLPSEVLPHISVGFVGAQARKADRLRIAFAGTLRKDRARPELVGALSRLRERSPGAADSLELSFHLARPTPFAEGFIRALPAATRIVLEEGEDALARAMVEADVLLDLECEADRPLLLTKVAQYLAAGRPIWTLCAPGGTTWGLVQEGWGLATPLGDEEAAAGDLERLHAEWATGTLAAREPSAELRARVSPERQVEDLFRLLEQLAERPA